MFDLGWSELLIIAVVAIVIVGPRELPKLLRTFGNMLGRMRRMAGEFQDQFREAMREAEMEETRRELEKLREVDPLKDIKNEVASVADQARVDPAEIAAPAAPEAPPPPAEPEAGAAAPSVDAPPEPKRSAAGSA